MMIRCIDRAEKNDDVNMMVTKLTLGGRGDNEVGSLAKFDNIVPPTPPLLMIMIMMTMTMIMQIMTMMMMMMMMIILSHPLLLSSASSRLSIVRAVLSFLKCQPC